MDALSAVLRSVRLTGGLFLEARFTAPWCVTAKVAAEDCKPFLAAPVQVIAYHFVVEGRLMVGVDDDPPFEVTAGEVVLLPRNDAHTLASAPGLTPIQSDNLIQPSPAGGLARIDHGGGGVPTTIICGFLGSEDAHNPLLATLPRLLKLDIRRGTSRDWVEASVRFAAHELAQGRFASSDIVSRLSELLFVEAVREYAATENAADTGWLKGLRDPHIGRALALIHGDLAAPWTAESLSGAVAMSRSAFNECFASLIGMPPIRYLTFWRMQKAKQSLTAGQQTISQIAHAVGYESDEAFTRAFKREFGLPPARWREQKIPR